MHSNSGGRPPLAGRPASTSRPDGTSPALEAGGIGLEGRPPGTAFAAIVLSFAVSAGCFFIGAKSDAKVLQSLGFLFGSFVSVISLAWFIVQDNIRRSLPYRDWRVSARSIAPWILIASWITGTANVFLLALDISRSFVE